ncbi:hypothetical protein GEMRC1_006615 [Eukaryota sp. GEM-RC1]
MSPLYSQPWFRKKRFLLYGNNQRSEKNMAERLKLTFGSPSETVIAFGDWSGKSTGRRGKAPTIKGLAMRTILRKHGFQVFLTDEYRTSKCCSACASKGIEGVCSNVEEVDVKYKPKVLRNLGYQKAKLRNKIRRHNRRDSVNRRSFPEEWQLLKGNLLEDEEVEKKDSVGVSKVQSLWDVLEQGFKLWYQHLQDR